MAPREATGTFPDQFLTFDYESAVPLGVPALHDQGPNGNNEDGGGGDGGDQDAGEGLGDALNHVETGTGPASDAQHQARSGATAQVDPLSIDPTVDHQMAATWPSFASHYHHERHQQSPHMAAAAALSVSVTEAHGYPHHPNSLVPSFPSSVESPIPPPPLPSTLSGDLGSRIHDDASSSGPLSTGTSYLHATTAPNSPLSFASSSAVSASFPASSPASAGARTSISTATGAPYQHQHQHQQQQGPSNRPQLPGGSSAASPASSTVPPVSFHLPARNLLSALSASVTLASTATGGPSTTASQHEDNSGGAGWLSQQQQQQQALGSPRARSVPGLDRTIDTSFSSSASTFPAASSAGAADPALPAPPRHRQQRHHWAGGGAAMDADDEDHMDGEEEEDDAVAVHHSSRPHSPSGSSRRRRVRNSVLSVASSDDDSDNDSDNDNDSVDSLRMIYRNSAFDDNTEDADGDDPGTPSSPMVDHSTTSSGGLSSDSMMDDEEVVIVAGPGGAGRAGGGSASLSASAAPPSSPTSIMLSFGPNTTVSDLKYFAERGCIVALLQALTTPRLVTLGTRMLADYAKMSHRRVAVASNRRILEFVQRTMLQVSEPSDWLGREYAVETVRSLTATEESDRYLMGTYGMLNTLALVARGGPFVTHIQDSGVRCTVPLASEKARLHACIAIMNLSCGKANKIEIAKIRDILESMRDVMLNSTDEARLKATTCVKNLSNADANDAALLGTPGLVEALGHVAALTCSPESGATPCTTNACLALMNLSISKANKHRVYRTPGVMDALVTVLDRTTGMTSSAEARVKACSALSNLAIGYDNKIPMFNYPGFVEAILRVIEVDTGESRTKACSILWSFAAEMKNQVPVVQRGDILPTLVRVADEDGTTEARFKCVAALTLLAESLENAIPLLEAGALHPLMDILHEAGPDPTQWKGQTASWCVGFLMNIAQSDDAVPALREAGVVELLAPLLTLDHYQSLKAAMAVTFCCRFDEGDECYDLLRKTENVIPKIISLLHNTLSGRGGNGYKYGVFTLRSSVGCISALALGPDFMKERIATGPVFESLLRVVTDFCVDGGTPGAIVGGGRDDALSATLAVRALQSLTGHLIPIAGSSALPFGQSMEERLLIACESFECCQHPEVRDETRQLATDARIRIEGGRRAARHAIGVCNIVRDSDNDADYGDVASMASHCCGFEGLPGLGQDFLHALTLPSLHGYHAPPIVTSSSVVEDEADDRPVRTFLLSDSKSGRRFVVPLDPSGGRAFNDTRVWCYRRGRFCLAGEVPDPDFVWTSELQQAYESALSGSQGPVPSPSTVVIERWTSS